MRISSSWIICCCYFLILCFYTLSPTAQQPPPYPPPTANLSTTWTINKTNFNYERVKIDEYILGRLILLRKTKLTRFALGILCQYGNNYKTTSYFFAIFIYVAKYEMPSPLVWSANRDHPVHHNAVLNFSATGELILRDADGSMVWTTNTAGKSVVGMNLTDTGNLVLYDVNHQVVWQSFDHPTDCLLLGQNLYQGQKLISSLSSKNWTTQKGNYSLQVTDEGLFSYIESNPPQPYFSKLIDLPDTSKGKSYVKFLNGSLTVFINSTEPSDPDDSINITPASSVQYMKLMPDGHLRVFEWKNYAWSEVDDLLAFAGFGECAYPLACGRNAICTNRQQCVCPVSSSHRVEYFRPVNNQEPSLGCYEITPITCNATHDQDFIKLEHVKYFIYIADMEKVDIETCKQACLNNCSCKAAMFQYGSDSSDGDCYLPSDLFTMMNVDPNVFYFNASAFVKVQNVRSPASSTPQIPRTKSRGTTIVITSIAGSFLLLLVVVGFIIFIIRKRRWEATMEEEYINDVPGMPTRFSYAELKSATENFSKKLGQGGFGSVFEGTIEDGSKIAVKCLEGLGQVYKSFLAEVESIGSIHHVNLVRLRGFCAWKSERFLVYDFMSNGSLDRWIYHRDREHVLDWKCRKKIIHDIAKGLAYLHEDCRQKIIHLDIKPQNILLDDDFNAKVSDFGLSKLIDRNETEVMTTMRGTPGYLAPEWLSSVITEKVDVYSFGIVLLEILCGRKNFDRSQPEESWHLLNVFQRCWEHEVLLDIVDKYCEDMQKHDAEVVEMMKVASWCLQTDYNKRPSMSTVIKVLDGMFKIESDLDYNFTDPRLQKTAVEHEKDFTPLVASVLSGPR